jgi:hypothetical protein
LLPSPDSARISGIGVPEFPEPTTLPITIERKAHHELFRTPWGH